MMHEKEIQDFTKYAIAGVPCPMCYVEGGTMEIGEGDDKHSVTIPSFYMGQYQVTQSLYEKVKGRNPLSDKGAMYPVTNISWDEAKEFMEKLNAINNKGFRLPSESEWEYAARGGMESQGYVYSGSDDLKQVGWFRENSGLEPKPVGLLLPNELGLYDMSGNILEWCEDDYQSNFRDASTDGRAVGYDLPSSERAAYRVVRGGDYFGFDELCRSADRFDFSPGYRFNDIGFRLVFSSQS